MHILISVLACLLMCGCGRPAGVLFPPPATALVWPGGAEPARLRYVGQIQSSDDLKPSRSSLDTIGQAIFGKPDRHAMVTPFAVCTDGADRLFVADSSSRVVHVFDLARRRYDQWKPDAKQPQLVQPVGIAWDTSGRLLVADAVAACIFAFDTKGQYQGQVGRGALKRPCGIAVEPATRNIYIADSPAHQVVVLSPAGQELRRLGQRGSDLGQFNFPVDVAFDHHGRLYVADSLNFRVQQFSPELTAVRQIGSKGDAPGYFAQPKCLDVDSEDHLYVVDNRFEVVQIFDAEGQLLMVFGKEGRGPGEFWLPTGMFIDPRDRIWIADSFNQRVQVFDYLPAGAPTPTTMPETRQ